MGHFDTSLKARAYITVVQEKNMQQMGLTEEQYKNPEYLADFLTELWNNSGKGRSCAVAVCESPEGLYHAHMALYGNTTTLHNVIKILCKSHVEPQLGGKKELSAYMLKEGKYEEKREKVLYVTGVDNIQDIQGKRNDLDTIEELLVKGWTPQEILNENIHFYRYENIIRKAYLDQRIRESPPRRSVYCEYHVGESGSGKTYYYNQLCEKYGTGNIYLLTDFDNGASGGLDNYVMQGAPPILFIDEFKGEGISYAKLLIMLNEYPRMQTHSRYTNTYNLWSTCIITSIYPLEDLYSIMVQRSHQKIDSYYQLLRRIDKIVYHYKENGEYKSYSINASEYTNYDNLIRLAKGNHVDKNGFHEMDKEEIEICPFSTDN